MEEKTACIIIHGFGGNVGEVKPLSDYLAARGFYVLCPSLKGHSGKRKDLSGVKYRDWIKSVEDELLRLSPKFHKIVLIGFSMGGLIAANLAVQYDIAAIATLNTPIYYWDIKRICSNILRDIKAKSFNSIKYYLKSSFHLPFSALLNFRLLLTKTRPLFRQVQCPIFIAQGLLDDTVQHRSADYIYRNVHSALKEKKYYPHSSHLICHSPDKDALFEDVFNFINKV